MKKYLMSLAALMITMTASMMTSCSNDTYNEKIPEVIDPVVGTHVETITIAFPDQAQSRVAMDGSYNLTCWEENDEVTLVKINLESNCDPEGMPMGDNISSVETYAFTCTDPSNNTFTGTLPDGTNLSDCLFAIYNGTGFSVNSDSFSFSPKTRASQNMKEVVVMVANNNGNNQFAMQIFGSILEVTNNTGADITASVKYRWSEDSRYYDGAYNYFDGSLFSGFETNPNSNVKHTFTLSKDAPTYVYIPVYNLNAGNDIFAVGLSAEGDATNECSIVPFKTNPHNAKLFKKTLYPLGSIGTAKATIGGSEVDVNWVQLWAGGPKFAEYNVGVTDGKAESYGGYYAWGGSQDKVDDHNRGSVDLTGDNDTATKLWGDAWRMPEQGELDNLLANCDVVWTTVNGVSGRKFTGKGAYASNSIFLPAAGYCERGNVVGQRYYSYYWSSTPDGSNKAYVLLFNSGRQDVGSDDYRNYGYSVRAVLVE